MVQNSAISLIFVYNADTTIIAQAFDFVHKLVSSETYNCNLCRLTYGVFSVKKDWGQFVSSLPVPTTFLHRDQFTQKYPRFADVPLPSVFMHQSNDDIYQMIDASELNRLKDLEQLKAILTARIARI